MLRTYILVPLPKPGALGPWMHRGLYKLLLLAGLRKSSRNLEAWNFLGGMNKVS